jgi:hypothetical protein
MIPKLTDEQQLALDGKRSVPLYLIDERTGTTYVLLRADLYERAKTLIEGEEAELRDTYPAQLESAMRAGWNDPAMDDYNNYDENRKRLWP